MTIFLVLQKPFAAAARRETPFAATGYFPEKTVSFIADSNGKFEKMWQFSSYLVKKGCKIVSISSADKFPDGNIQKVPENAKQFVIRACCMGTETESAATTKARDTKPCAPEIFLM